jgi:hypothetical protein
MTTKEDRQNRRNHLRALLRQKAALRADLIARRGQPGVDDQANRRRRGLTADDLNGDPLSL